MILDVGGDVRKLIMLKMPIITILYDIMALYGVTRGSNKLGI